MTFKVKPALPRTPLSPFLIGIPHNWNPSSLRIRIHDIFNKAHSQRTSISPISIYQTHSRVDVLLPGLTFAIENQPDNAFVSLCVIPDHLTRFPLLYCYAASGPLHFFLTKLKKMHWSGIVMKFSLKKKYFWYHEKMPSIVFNSIIASAIHVIKNQKFDNTFCVLYIMLYYLFILHFVFALKTKRYIICLKLWNGFDSIL